MKKIITIIGAILTILVFSFLILRITTGEDTWICEDGQWMKHGNPNASMPTEPCGNPQIIGGERDVYGCLGPAGYSWDEAEMRCVKNWIEVDNPERYQVTNFMTCSDAGYPIMESYPRQCLAPHGKTYTEEIGNEIEKIDLIIIDYPRPGTKITSPLNIRGQARGTWFFEGDFPVVLTDWDGRIIAEGHATAQGEWMTEDFVNFTARLEFEKPELYDRGSLILQKDNPSDLPENDDALEISIFFE
jgi:hypothetical protein